MEKRLMYKRENMQQGGEGKDEEGGRNWVICKREVAELAPSCECCGWLVPSSGLSLERD